MHGGMIQIRTLDADEDLRALRSWLSDEDELRGRIHLSEQPAQIGHMGGLADAVTIAVSGGGAATVAVRSLYAWLAQRQRGHRARLTFENGNGRRLEIEIDGLHNADAVLEKVLEIYSSDG